MSAPRYAPAGYKFFSVSTPSVFIEIMLPKDERDSTPEQNKQYDKLEALAERHGTQVRVSNYELG